MRQKCAVLFFIALGLMAVGGCAAADKHPAENNVPKIGVILPLSGQYAEYGKQILAGIKCAEEELSKEAFTSVMPELVIRDDAGKPSQAVRAMAELEKTGVMLVLAGYTSQEALALKSQAALLELPVLTPAGSNDQITERSKYMFRTNFSDRRQAQALAYYGYFNAGKRRMAYLINLDENAVYARDLGRQVAQAFSDFGGAIVTSAGFRDSDRDFRPMIKEILPSSPDIIFVPAYSEVAGNMVSQLREMGFKGVILGSDSWYGNDFLRKCGKEPAPAYFAASYVPETSFPVQQQFVRLFKNKYSCEPGVNEALGYDAMRIAFFGIQGCEDREDVQKRLARGYHMDTTAGVSYFDTSGNAFRPVFINEVKKADDGRIYLGRAMTVTPDMLGNKNSSGD